MKLKKTKEVFAFKKEDLCCLREYFLKNNKIVIWCIINIGVNVALRYSDLAALKFEDIDEYGIVRITEKKTNKIRDLKLNKVCLESLKILKDFYIKQNLETKGFLFKSLNREYIKKKIDKPITLQSFNRYLQIAKVDLNIPYRIGSHSLRKTWGYFYYKETKNIALIMKILNHSSAHVTLKYVGIERENLYFIYENFLL